MDKTLSLTDLHPNEANLILEGLGELPAKRSHFLLNKLRAQMLKQMTEPEPPVAPVVEQ